MPFDSPIKHLEWLLGIPRWIDEGDLCSTLLLAGLLGLVGAALVQRSRYLQTVGVRIGSIASLLFVADQVVRSWPPNADQLVGVLLKGLVVAALAIGLSWILLTILFSACLLILVLPFRVVRGFFRRTTHNLRSSRERRQERRRRRREAREEARHRPERERQAREAAERWRIDQAAGAQGRRQCEDVRLQCDLTYERYAASLSSSLPRPRYERLKKTYLADEHGPELVRQRSEQLREMILEAAGAPSSPTGTLSSLRAIAEHYRARRQEIDELPFDIDTKDTLRVIVNQQEEEALRTFLS